MKNDALWFVQNFSYVFSFQDTFWRCGNISWYDRQRVKKCKRTIQLNKDTNSILCRFGRVKQWRNQNSPLSLRSGVTAI